VYQKGGHMVKTKFNILFRKRINKRNIKNLKNDNFTLIANNCNAGYLYRGNPLNYNMGMNLPFSE
jgi:uncharacterized protein (DUF1919 family)